LPQFRWILALGLAAVCAAQDKQPPPAKPAPPQAQPARPRLEAAARRNENVQVNRIDNDAIKEANIRLGNNVTVVAEAPVEVSYYATEHGRPAGESPFLRAGAAARGWHGELYEWHQNSVFNARTFFQVGDVKPSRRNSYGGRLAGAVPKVGWFSVNASQRKIRGMVNGNVLAPLANERTPLASDPAVRALVGRFLAAYPAELPNRTDFDPRALNINAPQRIDETDADARLDRELGGEDRLSAFYSLSRQRVDAFQLVAGQNPDNEIHSQRARLTWRRAVSSATDVAAGLTFQRVKSVLRAEPNAVGPRVRMGYQIEELGPDSMFPIDRAQNTFRGGFLLRQSRGGGRHVLTLGGDLTRLQLNGIESNNQRGLFMFTSNFGRTALENLRLGTPSLYEGTIGELARGFRNWMFNAFFGDKWKVAPRFEIYFGLRYSADTTPVEVNRLNQIPYGCDCNNLSPRFSMAWQMPAAWVMRSGYTVSFGQIPAVTYQQVRNNTPLVHYIQVQNPDLLDPLRGINRNHPNVRTSPTVLSPDLTSPYSHQYNFSLERRLAGQYLMRLGYVGSRTIKLLHPYILNRADPVPGIPLTTATVDQRRPDPRYYEVKYIGNGGVAYLDAAQATLELPMRRGVGASVSYTFGKAIDQGADYTSTGANQDLSRGRSQWHYENLADRKGLSNFDSTHALLLSYYWDLPSPRNGPRALAWLGQGWQISGATLLKSGTPLTLYVGSDAPGYGNVDGGSADRPNIVDPSILGATISHPDTAPLILRRDRFAYIVPGEPRGNLGRGTFRKDGIANFNAAASRQWRWGGRGERTVLLRAEAYNLTNHAQFDEPQRNLSAPPFGKITNTLNDGRVLQVGLRLVL